MCALMRNVLNSGIVAFIGCYGFYKYSASKALHCVSFFEVLALVPQRVGPENMKHGKNVWL